MSSDRASVFNKFVLFRRQIDLKLILALKSKPRTGVFPLGPAMFVCKNCRIIGLHSHSISEVYITHSECRVSGAQMSHGIVFPWRYVLFCQTHTAKGFLHPVKNIESRSFYWHEHLHPCFRHTRSHFKMTRMYSAARWNGIFSFDNCEGNILATVMVWFKLIQNLSIRTFNPPLLIIFIIITIIIFFSLCH